MRNRTTNTFSGGMVQDADPSFRRQDTYHYALNGRIIFNTTHDGSNNTSDISDVGHTGSFVNENGNALVFSLCSGYKIVGYVDCEDDMLVFATNGINSEIGVVTVTASPFSCLYRPIYNDRYDPNGDKLNLSSDAPISGKYIKESDVRRRVYWNDGLHEDCVINISLAKVDGVFIHLWENGCNSSPSVYPSYWSAHNFKQVPDWQGGSIDYIRTTENAGSLLSGSYRYTYRLYTKDGYYTGWFPILTNKIFLPTEKISFAQTKNNHHLYQMGVSGQQTLKAIHLLVEVDSRYHGLEVAYIYQQTEDAVFESKVFKQVQINGFTSVNVIHDSLSGLRNLSLPELSIFNNWQKSSYASDMQDNRLVKLNVKYEKELLADTKEVTVEPIYRNMVSDTTLQPNGSLGDPNEFNLENDPITNCPIQSSAATIKTYNGNTKTHFIQEEYANYKGSQWSRLFTGYRRGDLVKLGLLLYDRKGQPLFVQPLPPIQLPQQYEDTAHFTVQAATGLWELRILGIKVSGIKLDRSILFDTDGKLKISGFSIVRQQVKSNVLHQGIGLPVVAFLEKNTDDRPFHTAPLPIMSNCFRAEYTSAATPDGHSSNYPLSAVPNLTVNGTDYTSWLLRPNYMNYYSPDVFLLQNYKAEPTLDYVKVIGSMHSVYGLEEVPLVGDTNHTYAKHYKSDGQIRNAQGRPTMGKESRVKVGIQLDEIDADFKEFDLEDKDEFFKNQCHILLNGGRYGDSLQCLRAVLLKVRDIEAMDVRDAQTNRCASFHVVNYLRPQTESKSDESPTGSDIYQSVGHYQSITPAILATITPDENGAYQFNEIEIYGGDTYLNYVDFTRLYPFYSGCKKVGGRYPDYAISHVFPNESKYNFALRFGRSFAKDGTNPQETSCDNDHLQFSNGIMDKQPEDWNVNKVLLQKEVVRSFVSKPNNTTILTELDSAVVWSNQKTYNEIEDSFRTFLPNNILILDGSYGQGVAFAKAFNNLYFVQENAYGSLFSSTREVITTTSGSAITLGTGTGIQGYQYISTLYGSRHKNSVISAENSIFFLDSRRLKMVRHSQAGGQAVSDSVGLHDEMALNLPPIQDLMGLSEACAVYDVINNEVIFTYGNNTKRKSIVFSKLHGKFTSFYSTLTPPLWGRLGSHIFSAKSHLVYANGIGRKGEFYGVFEPTKITFFVNPMYTVNKVFTSMLIDVLRSGYDRIKFVTLTCQDAVHSLNLQTDYRKEYRNGKLVFPANELEKELRLKGHYMKVDIYIDNAGQLQDGINKEVVITSIDTTFKTATKV